jgi:hypothetical protein
MNYLNRRKNTVNMVRENELLFTENPMKGLQPSKETIPGVTAAAP